MAADTPSRATTAGHWDTERDLHSISNGDSQPSSRRSAMRALIQDFSPIWFTWCMNFGICSILMHQLPYQFPGLRTISTILYLTDLLLFISFSILFIARLAIFKTQAMSELASDVQELGFVACWPISFMTLTSLTALVVSQAGWGGFAFTVVAYVMWWLVMIWALATTFIVYVNLTKKSLTDAHMLSLAIILPAVANSTTAAEGGIICLYATGITTRMAIPVIIVSFMLVGIGIWIATLIYALYLETILSKGWMDGAKRPQLMLTVGPMGQSSTALLALGTAATRHFGEWNRGTFLVAQAASSLSAACVLFSLLMFGFGIFWDLYGIYGILDASFRKEMTWSPAWYSVIFPNGTMCTAMIFFSQEMDSAAFRVVATVWLIILVIILLTNLAFTVHGIAKGKLLIVREDPRLKKKSRAPALPEIEPTESESTNSLIDVDSPHVVSVTSDFEDQTIKTETQATRLEHEAEDKARREAAKAEAAAAEAKKKAASKAKQAKESLKADGKKLKENSDNPVLIGNYVLLAVTSVAVGYAAYQKQKEGKLDWKVAGTLGGIVAAVGVADYFGSKWLLENKYPPK